MTQVDRLTVVSLIASGTEIVAALGFGEQLVGVSHECDYPSYVAGLPRLSVAKVDSSKPSGEIDQGVRSLAAAGGSAYELVFDEIKRLQPDVIVTQDVCDVCAVAVPDVSRAVADLKLRQTLVCNLTATDLDGVFEDFRRVGEALNASDQGERLVREGRERLARLERSTRGGPQRPRVAFIEWLDPPMIGGGWIPELGLLAGCQPVIMDRPDRFVQVEWSAIAREDPDYVIISPCGFTVSRCLREMEESGIHEGLKSIRAVRQGRCFVIDGHSYFNRPGPRLPEGVEILASLIHGTPYRWQSCTIELPFARWGMD